LRRDLHPHTSVEKSPQAHLREIKIRCFYWPSNQTTIYRQAVLNSVKWLGESSMINLCKIFERFSGEFLTCCKLALWQGSPVRSSPYPSALRLSSGHWPLFGEEKFEAVSRSFPYMLRFWYNSIVDNFFLTSHRIISLGSQRAGSALLLL
jgi:hypothetical protein